MIAALIRWSARNIFLILLATLFVVGAGIWAVRNTALDAIPDLSDTQVIVYTEYPGQAPQVVEDQVTYPLTTALLSVPQASDGFFYQVELLVQLIRRGYLWAEVPCQLAVRGSGPSKALTLRSLRSVVASYLALVGQVYLPRPGEPARRAP